ncbi:MULTISPECIES: MFS transporter [unclassified Streptomyces]|uniref:MFS transporter n=1 Tax=unclassified Streptomyces TaxID=2593676 RepID=UPI001313F015|nr:MULTISPECIES: MFS transporter [unclassified Streptomyces]
MSTATDTGPGREGVLPGGTGVWWFTSAGLLNSLGTGFFLSFALLFFQDVAALPLATVGTGLTAVTLAVLPLMSVLGRLADRVGPRALLIGAALARSAAFAGFLAADGLAAFLALAMLSSLGARAEQIGSPLLAVTLAGTTKAERGRWLALSRTVFNAGVGCGALLGGLLVGWGFGYASLGLMTAVGFLLAALLYLPLDGRPADRTDAAAAGSGTPPEEAGGSPWRDPRFVRVALAGALLFLAAAALESAVPVYLLTVLGLPGWTVGALFALNTALLILGQLPLSRRLERHSPGRVLLAGALIATVSFLLFPVAGALGAGNGTGASVAVLAAAMTGWTVSEMIVFQTVAVVLTSIPTERQRGAYLAANQIPVGVATALAPLFVTSMLAVRPAALFWVLGALALTAGFLARKESPTP